jgi:hypothetical protein
MTAEELRASLNSAHQEALRVGDSPPRADALAARVLTLAGTAEQWQVGEEARSRIASELADAYRVLHRDDDGREAARHLQGALRWVEGRPRAPSPFGDD